MTPLKPSTIATQDARRLARVLSEIGGEGAPVDSGWMACDQPGSWSNFAAGLGLDGPVAPASLDSLVDFYRTRGRRPRIQVTPYQHPTLLEGLTTRGFVSFQTETVLARELTDLPAAREPTGLTFRPVDPTRQGDVDAFRDSQMTAFYDHRQPPTGMLAITERVARADRVRSWLFERGGQVVGSGGLETYEDTAVLIAGCVHPEARNQGVHSAFIRFRMQQAELAGLRMVTVASTPGGPTEKNALRAGFSTVYTQTTLEQKE